MRKGSWPVAMLPLGVRFPVLASILNIETELSLRFTTKADLPEGSTATQVGWFPVVAVLGVFGVNTPVTESMVYCDTVFPESYALGT
jgi:hypothetical protein